MRWHCETSPFHKQWDGEPPWEPHPPTVPQADEPDVFQKQMKKLREEQEKLHKEEDSE